MDDPVFTEKFSRGTIREAKRRLKNMQLPTSNADFRRKLDVIRCSSYKVQTKSPSATEQLKIHRSERMSLPVSLPNTPNKITNKSFFDKSIFDVGTQIQQFNSTISKTASEMLNVRAVPLRKTLKPSKPEFETPKKDELKDHLAKILMEEPVGEKNDEKTVEKNLEITVEKNVEKSVETESAPKILPTARPRSISLQHKYKPTILPKPRPVPKPKPRSLSSICNSPNFELQTKNYSQNEENIDRSQKFNEITNKMPSTDPKSSKLHHYKPFSENNSNESVRTSTTTRTSFDFTQNAASQYKTSMNSDTEILFTEVVSEAKLLFNNAILKIEKDNRITKWLDEIENIPQLIKLK